MAKKAKPDLEAIDRAMARKPIDDGGPAFPRPLSQISAEEVSIDQDGMSLRDFFAAHAFSIFAHPTWPKSSDAPLIAETAYAIADAMIAERAK